MKRILIQRHGLAPGDLTTLTALVRDIHLTYPGEYEIEVDTSFVDLWRHNPHIKIFTHHKDVTSYKLDYGAWIRRANGGMALHFIGSWHRQFHELSGIHVPLHYPWPDLHLSQEEKTMPSVEPPYWVVLSGGKMDFTTKHWNYSRWQQVVDILRGFGLRFVQAGSNAQGDPPNYHPPLRGVTNVVGRTSLRDFMRLVYHAEGVMGPVTMAMHVAAAFHKPCVVLNGGREHWTWEAYHRANPGFGEQLKEKTRVNHRFLHTIDQLECCRGRGCWLSKACSNRPPGVPLKPGEAAESLCHRPVRSEQAQIIPLCMANIEVRHVVEAALSYYLDGTLPQEIKDDPPNHRPDHCDPAGWPACPT